MMIRSSGQYCQQLPTGVIPKLSSRMTIPAAIRINPIHKGGLTTFPWYLIFSSLQVELNGDYACRHILNCNHLDMRF
jgi:hypothetical protein